jgi:myo-inositol catabolism protein IolC
MGITETEGPVFGSLFILPFDHRGSLQKMLFEHKNELNDEEVETMKKMKKIIFEAIKKVGGERGNYNDLAILVDEDYGFDIHMEAKELGIRNALTTEKSGQEVYDFQYDDWGDHIKKIQPTLVKALIRVVIGQDNSVQNSRLKELSDFCDQNNFKFLLEPLVFPSDEDLEQMGGDKKKFDAELRPQRFAEAVKELHEAGVMPDVWKIEGTETKEGMDICSDAVMEGGKPNPQIVILGRGESAEKVDHWLTVGAKSAGVNGFAVGRTIFADAISKLHKGEINEEEAINTIAENYKHFIKVFEKARA